MFEECTHLLSLPICGCGDACCLKFVRFSIDMFGIEPGKWDKDVHVFGMHSTQFLFSYMSYSNITKKAYRYAHIYNGILCIYVCVNVSHAKAERTYSQ